MINNDREMKIRMKLTVRYEVLVRFGDFLTEEASLYAIISFVFFGYFLDLKINKLKNA